MQGVLYHRIGLLWGDCFGGIALGGGGVSKDRSVTGLIIFISMGRGDLSLIMPDLCSVCSLGLPSNCLYEESDVNLKGDMILATILTLMARHYGMKTVKWFGRVVGEHILLLLLLVSIYCCCCCCCW